MSNKNNRKGLPKNLHPNGNSFRYWHPVKQQWTGMGPNKKQAIADARVINSTLVVPMRNIIRALGGVTVNDHIEWFFSQIVPFKRYAENTIDIYKLRCKQISNAVGHKPVCLVSVLDIAGIMDSLSPRPAQQLRQVATEIFKTAAGRGLIEINPGELTNNPIYRKSRKRITWDQYLEILSIAPQWMKNTMELAVTTLQRRSDIARFRFDGVKDGYLYVIQQKTAKYDTGYLRAEVGPELERIIRNCRDSVASPFMVHRTPARHIKRTKVEHWTQVTPAYITSTFKDLRDQVDSIRKLPVSERGGIHELKATGIKRYKDLEIDPQSLAGHSTKKMTNNYDSDHEEIRWIETKTL
jgi:integrase